MNASEFEEEIKSVMMTTRRGRPVVVKRIEKLVGGARNGDKGIIKRLERQGVREGTVEHIAAEMVRESEGA